MIAFGDKYYYLDLAAINKVVESKSKENKEDVEQTIHQDGAGNVIQSETVTIKRAKQREVDAIKYEMIRTCIDVIIDFDPEEDVKLGTERYFEKAPVSYKMAFNTLIREGILIETDKPTKIKN